MAKSLEDLIIDLGNLPQEIKKRINKEELGRSLVEKILQRVQVDGLGVEKMGDNAKRLKDLAGPTIERRKQLAKTGKLSDKTSAEKSNQTETGKMLDSLTFKVVPEGIEVFISDPTRQDVYGYQSKDRPWLYFSNEELEYIDDTVEKAIDQAFSHISSKL